MATITKSKIKCPHCGAEYLASEIYFPDQFLGRPRNIIKDEKGQILGFNDDDMNTYEEFTCDHCGKSFSVEATVTFKTSALNNLFDDDDDFDIEEVGK